MAVSEVSVINDALGELGEDVIVNRSENTARANAADRFFDQAKREFLEMSTWRFAAKYQQLARSSTDPAFKYDYRYALPSDYVRIIEFNEIDVEDVQVPLHEVVSGYLHTDETSAKIVYVYDCDVSLFSPLAARALSFLLAVKMSRVLTDSSTQREEMLQSFKEAIRKAKAVDALQQKQPLQNKTAYSSFIASQIGSRYPNVTGSSSAY